MRAIDKLIQNASISEGTAEEYLNNQGETILNTNVTVTEVSQDISLAIGATAPSLSVEVIQDTQLPVIEGSDELADVIEVNITVSPTDVEINVGYSTEPTVIPAISTDPDNRARYGSDSGVFVPQYENVMDPVAYYILAKG